MNTNNVKNLSKDKFTIKAQSTQTIDFMGARPNYYKITNGGNSNLYLGVSMMPTKDFFDMKIPSSSSKLFVDAYGRDEIYIYNPSTEDTNIIITSFEAPFDATATALSDIGMDFGDIEIVTTANITGFECPLPPGTNTIGKVQLEKELTDKLINLAESMTDINTSGKVGKLINTILFYLYNNQEGGIMNDTMKIRKAIDKSSNSVLTDILSAIKNQNQNQNINIDNLSLNDTLNSTKKVEYICNDTDSYVSIDCPEEAYIHNFRLSDNLNNTFEEAYIYYTNNGTNAEQDVYSIDSLNENISLIVNHPQKLLKGVEIYFNTDNSLSGEVVSYDITTRYPLDVEVFNCLKYLSNKIDKLDNIEKILSKMVPDELTYIPQYITANIDNEHMLGWTVLGEKGYVSKINIKTESVKDTNVYVSFYYHRNYEVTVADWNKICDEIKLSNINFIFNNTEYVADVTYYGEDMIQE